MNQSIANNVEQASRGLTRVLERLTDYYKEFGLSEERALRSALADFAAEVPEGSGRGRGG